MRIKENFDLKEISGRYTVIAKDNSVKLRDNIILTDTAVYLWNLLKSNDTTKTQMLDGLINNFDISTVLALGDIDIFIRTMRENGIIEE